MFSEWRGPLKRVKISISIEFEKRKCQQMLRRYPVWFYKNLTNVQIVQTSLQRSKFPGKKQRGRITKKYHCRSSLLSFYRTFVNVVEFMFISVIAVVCKSTCESKRNSEFKIRNLSDNKDKAVPGL